jgi:hypothetical protein
MSLEGDYDDVPEPPKKKGLLGSVNEFLWKPFEISWPVAIASVITGSVGLTCFMVVALLTINTSGPAIADDVNRNVSNMISGS